MCVGTGQAEKQKKMKKEVEEEIRKLMKDIILNKEEVLKKIDEWKGCEQITCSCCAETNDFLEQLKKELTK